ncbi:uncharacterized protein LOC105793081 [Gossypium raimondii]|uniref:uncharacterized protein LOC105793081 n=1 Tax=Gossypium raimondii TaxID=29730 RepID=UPI00063AAFCD|nr:uncharacterized protein LOC105793081 [Gossypium raimondii]
MSFTPPPPPVFTGEYYHIWIVKMNTYLQAHDLWSVIENDAEPPSLRANPTIAQIRQHSEERAKKHKAIAYLQNGVSDVIFTCIMACDSPKQAWEKLKEEFMGTDKTRQQQVINLRRDFENLRMKESETTKQYSDRIMAIVNSIRFLGVDFTESRVVEKQMRANRQEENPEAAFQVKASEGSSMSVKGKKPWHNRRVKSGRDEAKNVCKGKPKEATQQQARPAEDLQTQEEHVFIATCYVGTTKARSEWLLSLYLVQSHGAAVP